MYFFNEKRPAKASSEASKESEAGKESDRESAHPDWHSILSANDADVLSLRSDDIDRTSKYSKTKDFLDSLNQFGNGLPFKPDLDAPPRLYPGCTTTDEDDERAISLLKTIKRNRKIVSALKTNKKFPVAQLVLKKLGSPGLDTPNLMGQLWQEAGQAEFKLRKYIDELKPGDIVRMRDKCQRDKKFRKRMEKWYQDIKPLPSWKQDLRRIEDFRRNADSRANVTARLPVVRQGSNRGGIFATGDAMTDYTMVKNLKQILYKNKWRAVMIDVAAHPLQMWTKKNSRALIDLEGGIIS
jgi:hypothetical protein